MALSAHRSAADRRDLSLRPLAGGMRCACCACDSGCCRCCACCSMGGHCCDTCPT